MSIRKLMGTSNLNNIVFNNKRRWMAEIVSQDGKTTYLKQTFVKVSANPLNDQEKEYSQVSDFVYEYKYKERQKLVITSIDIDNGEELKDLYDWFSTIYELTTSNKPTRPEKLILLVLRIYNSVGQIISTNILKDVLPVMINFEEIDHSNSDLLDVNFIFSYSELEYRDESGIVFPKK